MDGSFCVHKLDNLSKSANFIINFQLLLFSPLDGMDKTLSIFCNKDNRVIIKIFVLFQFCGFILFNFFLSE